MHALCDVTVREPCCLSVVYLSSEMFICCRDRKQGISSPDSRYQLIL